MKTLNIEDLGCEELRVSYGCQVLFWWPQGGTLRFIGQSHPAAQGLKTKRDLVLWLLTYVKG